MRSLRTRLALSLFVIAFGAGAIVGGGVLKARDSAFRDTALKQLMATAQRGSRGIDPAIARGDSARHIDTLVRDAADAATARVTLMGLYKTDGDLRTYPKSDSTRQVEIR